MILIAGDNISAETFIVPIEKWDESAKTAAKFCYILIEERITWNKFKFDFPLMETYA